LEKSQKNTIGKIRHPKPKPSSLGLLGVQKTVVIKIQRLLALQLLILQAYLQFNQKFLTEFEYRTFIKQ
jgi:hypothetical protein